MERLPKTDLERRQELAYELVELDRDLESEEAQDDVVRSHLLNKRVGLRRALNELRPR